MGAGFQAGLPPLVLGVDLSTFYCLRRWRRRRLGAVRRRRFLSLARGAFGAPIVRFLYFIFPAPSAPKSGRSNCFSTSTDSPCIILSKCSGRRPKVGGAPSLAWAPSAPWAIGRWSLGPPKGIFGAEGARWSVGTNRLPSGGRLWRPMAPLDPLRDGRNVS
uniref:Uncharacterized protein n=1 Tax=Placozoa sp. H17 HM-2017 TaxID=2017600 RepID=A0A7I6N5P7_9METZ|nr:hypothetical protein [Placozoa sp. H17 HM-2017]